jgi:hypothetical protein
MTLVLRGVTAPTPRVRVTVSILDQAGEEVAHGGGVLGVDWTLLERSHPETVPTDLSDYALTPVLNVHTKAWSEYRVVVEVSESVPGDRTVLTPTFLVCWQRAGESGGQPGESPPTSPAPSFQHRDDQGRPP